MPEFLYGIGVRVLPANDQARHIASQFMQPKRDSDPFFPRHCGVAFDLHLECGRRVHNLRAITVASGLNFFDFRRGQ
jgi:hypothetical protein